MKVYDLSPLLSEKTGVFPGDVSFRRNIAMSFEQGHHLALSSITTTLHIGSHADAVSHYAKGGVGISDADLSRYIGRAVVVRAKVPRGQRVVREHLSDYGRKWLDRAKSGSARKFLLFTDSFPDPDNWNSDFCSYDPKLIEELAAAGVHLIGIDTPSIDPEDSKTLDSHQKIHSLGLSVLEGLCLGQVPEGEYWLVAAPLKIEGADAAPVRALLLDGDFTFR